MEKPALLSHEFTKYAFTGPFLLQCPANRVAGEQVFLATHESVTPSLTSHPQPHVQLCLDRSQAA